MINIFTLDHYLILFMSKNHNEVAVVTGSSTGIGFETSLALARKGYITCATMRNIQKAKLLESIARKENIPIKVFEMDVNNDIAVSSAITKVINEYGRIDILVNNAGYGLFGALEDFTIADIKNQFETNVFGIIRVIQNVLPVMRSQMNGIIINISSISGLAGIPAQSAYCGTKFAVEGVSEAISYELEPFGIKVILVEPGVVNTEFVQDLVVPTNKYGIDKNGNQINLLEDNNTGKLSFYNDIMKKFLMFYYNAMSKAPHPKVVADEIIKGIEKNSDGNNTNPILRIVVGNDSKRYSKFKKEFTDSEFHKLLNNDLLKINRGKI